MAMLDILAFLFMPRAFLVHLIGGGLMYALVGQGVSLAKVVPVTIGCELISLVFWYLIPNSISTVLSLAVFIHLYERIAGPRLQVQENAVFLSDDEVAKLLQQVSPTIPLQISHTDDRTVLGTGLPYIVYTSSLWGSKDGKGGAIDINDVTRIEDGCDFNVAKVVRNKGSDPDLCFFLVVGDETSVTFIAPDKEEKKKWVDALKDLFGSRFEEYQQKWIQKMFKEADIVKQDEQLTLDEAVDLLNKADRPSDKNYMKDMFNTFAKLSAKNKGEEAALDIKQFVKFFDLAGRRPEITQIFDRLLDRKIGELVLPPHKLMLFAKTEQKEDVSTGTCREWIKKVEKVIPPYSLSPIGFTSLLLDEDHSIIKRECKSVYQDMRRPMSHYYIATSHNTYLMKDQLKGKSSVEAYINAFKRGCKCVELDTWDGPNNEPIIYHGHTLTSKILFKDVVKAIGEHAFDVSPYPVILSFENHCSIEQQKVMAKHLVEILGSKMYTKPPPEYETVLPSPDDLKGYIIVKAKKLKANQNPDEVEDEDDEFSDIEEDDIDNISLDDGEEKESTGSAKVDLRGSLKRMMKERKQSQTQKKHKVPKIAQELSDLVAYCQAVHFKGFEYSKNNAHHYDMSSFAEKRAVKFCNENCPSLVEYNRRQFSRIYPAGSRVDSSNYDPQPMWNCGCHLVALNYQTPDRPMQMNQGLFMDNGGCGYVLKPDFMTNDNIDFDPRGPFDQSNCKFLMMRIISGNQLPYSKESRIKSDRRLSVEVVVSGVDPDNQKYKTKPKKNTGLNPQFNEMIPVRLHLPELAMIQFVVREETEMIVGTDTTLAQVVIPFRCMQQGYRRVPLMTKASEPLPYASLFVHIDVRGH